MSDRNSPSSRAHRRLLAGVGAVVVAITALSLVGIALAKTFTLTVAHGARVTNVQGQVTHENIVVTGRGRAVYTLSGDSAHHPECTAHNGCFAFWPPVTVRSAHRLNKAGSVRGRLGTWRRDGFLQVTLSGHPLYNFAGDPHVRMANGEGIQSFGGTWHVGKGPARRATGTPASTPMPSAPSGW